VPSGNQTPPSLVDDHVAEIAVTEVGHDCGYVDAKEFSDLVEKSPSGAAKVATVGRDPLKLGEGGTALQVW